MAAAVIVALIGVAFIALGISNMKGNISSLHDYHRVRVASEDVPALGKKAGLGNIIIGAAVAALGVFLGAAIYADTQVYLWVGLAVFAVGFAVGLRIILHALRKYNGGVF